LNNESQRWVIVAHILRPRGNKGEVAAELLSDFPERLKTLRELYVGEAGGKTPPRRVALQSCWINRNHPGQIIFHFESCSSITEAENLRGLDVLLPIEQRVSLPAGQYFVSDLIGCLVFELPREETPVSSSPCSLASAPALLGTVTDVQFTGEDVSGTPLLVVDTADGELLVPLAHDICKRIDTAARRIEVALPEGLGDLNVR
jgi:16S rRNA processing protein RimM